jgi:prepilin-type N-terminal cleavage/methylation domain-containing protein
MPSMAAVRRRAFTLTELLVVITVIAILAMLLLPSLQIVRFQAKRIACASNQRQLVMATRVYLNDSDGQLWAANPASNDVRLIGNSAVSGYYTGHGWLFDYLETIKPFFCSDIAKVPGTYGNNWSQMSYAACLPHWNVKYGFIPSDYVFADIVRNQLVYDRGPSWNRVDRWPGNPGLFSDVIEWTMYQAQFSPHGRRGWNVASRDGSVRWIGSKEMPNTVFTNTNGNFAAGVPNGNSAIQYFWNTVSGFNMFTLNRFP